MFRRKLRQQHSFFLPVRELSVSMRNGSRAMPAISRDCACPGGKKPDPRFGRWGLHIATARDVNRAGGAVKDHARFNTKHKLLTQPTLFTRNKTLLPVIRERQMIADGLARYLAQLGLERRSKQIDLARRLQLTQRAAQESGAQLQDR
jgi:hypothetical protein